MKRVLIVEDEKMIRQGLAAIVKRSEVPVEEIIECRNGEEALKVIMETQIDLMFTDIRMPKMDGITLAGELEKRNITIRTVVISGFDDFNYAVEMLRRGVKEYILKPIKREKINEILRKTEEELKKEQEFKNREYMVQTQQLKYLLLHHNLTDAELQHMEEQFSCLFTCDEYQVAVNHNDDLITAVKGQQVIYLEEIKGFHVYIVSADADEEVFNRLKAAVSGISSRYRRIEDLALAYEEAAAMRKEIFFNGSIREHKVYDYDIKDNFVEQFVQQFGTDKFETGIGALKEIYFAGKRGRVAPEQLLALTAAILSSLQDTYHKVFAMDEAGVYKFTHPLAFSYADEYLTELVQWLRQMKQILIMEFEDNRNKEKIHMAIQYIHENYHKDLNMAMVSNYVSMNYSLFSIAFKQYTQVNFVNYLKSIRMKEAKKLLETTERKVLDISRAVGYENEKHFMKLFKENCGVSPSEYRKNKG